MTNKVEIEYKITGRVQMVMYRDFVQRSARALGLVGFVKNNKDGSVTVVAQGGEKKLQDLEKKLQKGSFFSHVQGIEKKDREVSQNYEGFVILY